MQSLPPPHRIAGRLVAVRQFSLEDVSALAADIEEFLAMISRLSCGAYMRDNLPFLSQHYAVVTGRRQPRCAYKKDKSGSTEVARRPKTNKSVSP
jgi:hypothetical protein